MPENHKLDFLLCVSPGPWRAAGQGHEGELPVFDVDGNPIGGARVHIGDAGLMGAAFDMAEALLSDGGSEHRNGPDLLEVAAAQLDEAGQARLARALRRKASQSRRALHRALGDQYLRAMNVCPECGMSHAPGENNLCSQ
jgi:ribosomal protein L32